MPTPNTLIFHKTTFCEVHVERKNVYLGPLVLRLSHELVVCFQSTPTSILSTSVPRCLKRISKAALQRPPSLNETALPQYKCINYILPNANFAVRKKSENENTAKLGSWGICILHTPLPIPKLLR